MKKIALLSILFILSGCATTEWQRLSLDYSERQLGMDKFEISFLMYNWVDDLDDELPKDSSAIKFFDGTYNYIYNRPLSDSAILNSARIAMDKGFEYFSIIDARYEVQSGPSMATVTVLCFIEKPIGMDHFFEAESVARSIKEKYGIK